MSTKYKPHVYVIRTLTNLHVGGGDSNYDHVDKQVQRDPSTGYPTIFASGLKGALRDYMVEIGETDIVPHIFGNEPGDSNSQQGAYRFLSADILALPSPATDKAFDVVTADSLINSFTKKVAMMGNGEINITDFTKKISETEFKELAAELPVIARNHLESGISQNLWYEEVVPREARFGFVVLVPENDSVNSDKFNNCIHDKVIQIGANATIGYGLCHFTKI